MRFHRRCVDNLYDSFHRHDHLALHRADSCVRYVRSQDRPDCRLRSDSQRRRLQDPDRLLAARKSKGRNYDDPAHPSGQIAAKTKIDTFICPSVPISNCERDPVHGYGGIDYMVVALSDVDSRPGSPTYGMRTTPAGSAEWKSQVVAPMLDCEGGGFNRVTDGTSHTILWIEDAGRAHPDVSIHGAYSTRFTPVSGAADPINMSSGANGRRVFAWADADAVSNGYSGPSNAISPGSQRSAA